VCCGVNAVSRVIWLVLLNFQPNCFPRCEFETAPWGLLGVLLLPHTRLLWQQGMVLLPACTIAAVQRVCGLLCVGDK
jgi:hypothetical protein